MKKLLSRFWIVPALIRRSVLSIASAILFGCGALLALVALTGNAESPGHTGVPPSSFQPGTATHQTQSKVQTASQLHATDEGPAHTSSNSTVPPTRRSFMATWASVNSASSYRLDVSTASSFNSFVDAYHDLDVGNVTGRAVTGLKPGTTYYYRVRPVTAAGAGDYSVAMPAVTQPDTGLSIDATFDSSIINNQNGAAIQAMITRAIAFHESLFNDAITIHIYFRYATTAPDGTHIPPSTLSQSDFVVYGIPWSVFLNALTADATTSNDSLATASFPESALANTVRPSSASGRAVGLDTPPAMFSNGHVGNGGPYDGIVTMNSAQSFQFSRPPDPNRHDAQRSVEHEVDEILGLGSDTNVSMFRPEDLFSWSAAGQRNITSSGTRYFSINSGSTRIVDFNQASNGDQGDWDSEDCPQSNPYVQNAFGCAGQFSDIGAASPEGVALDVIGYDLNQASLGNISTRSFVQTADDVMIGGFIVQGAESKRVIIRAIGPELSQYGVPNPLQDPTLELHDGNGALIGSNNDWQHTIIGGIIIQDQVQAINSSGHAPTDTRESAIIADLPAGNYTAIVRGVNNTTGVALVEVYDIGTGITSVLGNISTRSFVQTDNNVLIGGFIVQGTQPKTVVLRAIGPELSQYGVPNPLADPTLELHDANGALIGFNDNWQTTVIGGVITSDQVQDIQNSGHVPADPRESVIIAQLPPGNYTAIVRGVSGTTGVALVEVYDLR